jgi:hypothetical protein
MMTTPTKNTPTIVVTPFPPTIQIKVNIPSSTITITNAPPPSPVVAISAITVIVRLYQPIVAGTMSKKTPPTPTPYSTDVAVRLTLKSSPFPPIMTRPPVLVVTVLMVMASAIVIAIALPKKQEPIRASPSLLTSNQTLIVVGLRIIIAPSVVPLIPTAVFAPPITKPMVSVLPIAPTIPIVVAPMVSVSTAKVKNIITALKDHFRPDIITPVVINVKVVVAMPQKLTATVIHFIRVVIPIVGPRQMAAPILTVKMVALAPPTPFILDVMLAIRCVQMMGLNVTMILTETAPQILKLS